MSVQDLLLALLGPVTGLLWFLLQGRYEREVIAHQCGRVAQDTQLPDGAREVMVKTTESAVTVMTLFPSVIAFLASAGAVVVAAPVSPTVKGAMLVALPVAVLIGVAPSFYIVWSRSLYRLHDRAPRLFAKPDARPGPRSYLDRIGRNLLYMNVALIVVAVAAFVLSNRIGW